MADEPQQVRLKPDTTNAVTQQVRLKPDTTNAVTPDTTNAGTLDTTNPVTPDATTGSTPDTTGRQPPAGGRQDHFAMRADSMLHVNGPAGTDTLAAGGGLEVPGGDPASTEALVADLDVVSPDPEIIPGAYERDTATTREPGAIGGRFNGADQLPVSDTDIAEEEVHEEWRRIGGGKR